MNWLDPEEVREWLKRPPLPEPGVNFSTTRRELAQLAWAEFGRAVAAVEGPINPFEAWGKLHNLAEVARLIRDAEEGK